ncbi:MAG TPA: hypothetical protein VGO58_17290 [Chitinophagaceae bacterium]|jgi:hypothetical protein|nr:hypothetical protein [Chitinophagaceae bacterium]
MRKVKALAIFNALSLIVQLTMVYLTGAKMVNQKNVGEVSAEYETLFTPAGISFSIWGIIYITLGLLCLYHIVIAYKHDKQHPANTELLQMNGLFILVNLASAAWLVAWTQERLLVSLLLIFFQLVCLAVIHRRLNIYDPLKPPELKTATHFPLSVYLGWITIAAIANTASYLTAIGWDEDGFGLSPVQWTIIMISVAIIISVVMIFLHRNIYFALTVAWGLYGIILKRQAAGSDNDAAVVLSGWTGIAIIVVSSVIQLARNIHHRRKPAIFPTAATPLK